MKLDDGVRLRPRKANLRYLDPVVGHLQTKRTNQLDPAAAQLDGKRDIDIVADPMEVRRPWPTMLTGVVDDEAPAGGMMLSAVKVAEGNGPVCR